MTVFKKSFKALLSLVAIAVISFSFQTKLASASSFVLDGSVFHISGISDIAGVGVTGAQRLANLQIANLIYYQNDISVPTELSDSDLQRLVNSSSGTWSISSQTSDALDALSSLYEFVLNSTGADQTSRNFANSSISAISNFRSIYNSVEPPPTTAISTSIFISPNSFTEGSSQSVVVTGKYTGPDDTYSKISCVLYVGDGTGTYKKKEIESLGADHTCVLNNWDVSGTLISTAANGVQTNQRGVAVVFKDLSQWTPPESVPGSPEFPAVLPTPSAQDSITLVPKSTGITLSADKTALKQGETVTFTATIQDPGNYAEKMCYLYVGDGNGNWFLQGKASPYSCAITWTTSASTAVTDHGAKIKIQDSGLTGNGDPNGDAPTSNQINIKVCAQSATDCSSTAPNGGTPEQTTPFNGNITFSGSNNVKTVATPSGEIELDSVEGIFNAILYLASILIGVFAFFSLVIGGFQFMTSGGDSAAAEKGKKSIINGIIGIVVASCAYTIVAVVINYLK